MAGAQFGRPKKYKMHRDRGAFQLDPQRQFEAMAAVNATGSEVTKEHFGIGKDIDLQPAQKARQHGMLPRNEAPFYTKVNASFNDPRVVWYVADACINAMEGSYIRPRDLAFYLAQSKAMYHWDEAMVGRLLGGIFSACQESYYVHDYEDEVDWLPFTQGRDSKGRYYVLDPKGGDEGVLWMLCFRQAFYVLSENQMRADAVGNFKEYFGKEMQPGDWYASIYSQPVRAKSAYKAQLKPDDGPAPGVVVETQVAYGGTAVAERIGG